ncbi:MAG: tyrosine-type recombinase/integrase [Actinomycetia bacterium]|nr:tyrosine-type recombinase/integrase [Actinomycetes bacterium]
MSAAHIVVRGTAGGGRRYLIRYRLGGRGHRLRHAGSFRTRREAQARRDLVAGELAAGRDPKAALVQLAGAAPPARTLSQWTQPYLDSRVDWSQNTAASARFCLNRVNETLGHRDPHTITPRDIQQLVGQLSVDLKPATVRRYLAMLRPLLDYTGLEPNPARDRTVKLPPTIKEELKPPTGGEFLAILQATPAGLRLPLVVLEQTAIRVGELETLTWDNLDATSQRIRITSRNAKTRKPRWVDVPEWLHPEIEQTRPPADSPNGKLVFPGLTRAALGRAMRNACQQAGTPHYHPHDLRHRRLSL